MARLSRPGWLWLNSKMVYPRTVTHPSTNWARCKVTTYIKKSALTLSQAATVLRRGCYHITPILVSTRLLLLLLLLLNTFKTRLKSARRRITGAGTCARHAQFLHGSMCSWRCFCRLLTEAVHFCGKCALGSLMAMVCINRIYQLPTVLLSLCGKVCHLLHATMNSVKHSTSSSPVH